ncbi:hypothetical protein V6N13_118592 [Hibiscus sabdariffa]
MSTGCNLVLMICEFFKMDWGHVLHQVGRMANVVADRPVAELCGQESEELLFTCALSVVDDLLLRDMYPLPGVC